MDRNKDQTCEEDFRRLGFGAIRLDEPNEGGCPTIYLSQSLPCHPYKLDPRILKTSKLWLSRSSLVYWTLVLWFWIIIRHWLWWLNYSFSVTSIIDVYDLFQAKICSNIHFCNIICILKITVWLTVCRFIKTYNYNGAIQIF